jgi:hypothetical protein
MFLRALGFWAACWALLFPAPLCSADDAKPAAPQTQAAPADASKIQIAILLDTSNSMDGLINQARTQLWKIVNEFAKAKRDGKDPYLEVALYEYGNNGIDPQANYVRQVVPLSDDLDKISDELFALKTNGGNEFCGAVIDAALKNLAWSKSDQDLKCIFVCGNEPFTQGSIDPYKACQDAIEKGIVVNTIFCGPLPQGVNTGWQKGAQLADGSFVNIDQDQVAADIPAPQDRELARLSTEVNKTYVFFGAEELRAARRELQARQDALAGAAAPGAAAQRAASKAGKFYDQSEYDLVDALEKKSIKLEDLKDEDLPEELRKKSLEEKKAYVQAKAKERKEIEEKIKQLTAEREKFLAAEREKAAQAQGQDTLDTAVIKVIRAQAEKRKFQFEESQ